MNSPFSPLHLPPLGFSILALALAATPIARSATIDFTSTTSIADNLTQATVNTGGTSGSYGNLTRSDTAGLDGGAAASTPVKFSDNYGYTTKASFDGGFQTFTAGSYLYVGATWETGTSLVLNLGVTNAATASVGSGNSAAPVVFYGTVGIPTDAQSSLITSLRFSGSGSSPSANFISYSNGLLVTSSSNSATLTMSSWYYMETTFTQIDATTLSVATSLFSSDASGTIGNTAIITHSATVTNSTLLGSADLYGYIGSQNGNRRGVTVIDDLSFAATAIPEPASAGLLFGLVSLAGVALRRRR